MNMRESVWTGIVLLGTAGMVFAAHYSWTDEGTGSDWVTCDNWRMSPPGLPCYPSTGSADAYIPSGDWIINLADTTIDDMVIVGDVQFSRTGLAKKLTLDSLVIGGPVVAQVTGGNHIATE